MNVNPVLPKSNNSETENKHEIASLTASVNISQSMPSSYSSSQVTASAAATHSKATRESKNGIEQKDEKVDKTVVTSSEQKINWLEKAKNECRLDCYSRFYPEALAAVQTAYAILKKARQNAITTLQKSPSLLLIKEKPPLKNDLPLLELKVDTYEARHIEAQDCYKVIKYLEDYFIEHNNCGYTQREVYGSFCSNEEIKIIESGYQKFRENKEIIIYVNNSNFNYGIINYKDLRDSKVSVLVLRNNGIGDKEAKSIAAKLPPKLTYLDLYFNHIGAEGAKSLAANLPPTLTSLNLSGNHIGDEGAKSIAPNLPPTLASLNLGANDIGAEGAKSIAPNLPPTLAYLDLYGNHIGAEGAKSVAAKLPPTLTYLNLDSNHIGDEGTKNIAAKLPPTLATLNLTRNSIGDEGAKSIVDNLPPALTFLGLAGNNLGDEGAKSIAAKLPPTLTCLDLRSNNNITAKGGKFLLEAVAKIMLNGKKIRIYGVKDINEHAILQTMEELRPGMIESNWKKGLEEIATKIESSSTTELSLANYQQHIFEVQKKLTTPDLKPIFVALRDNKSVTKLDLSNNSEIDDKVIEPLIQTLDGEYDKFITWFASPNTTLVSINLSGTRVTEAGTKNLFTHIETLQRKVPRLGFTVIWNGGALKHGGAQEAKDAKQEKLKTEPSSQPLASSQPQSLTAAAVSSATATSSTSTEAKDPWRLKFDELLAKHQVFQSLEDYQKELALLFIEHSVNELRSAHAKIGVDDKDFNLEASINACISYQVRAIKTPFAVDPEEEKNTSAENTDNKSTAEQKHEVVVQTLPSTSLITPPPEAKETKSQTAVPSTAATKTTTTQVQESKPQVLELVSSQSIIDRVLSSAQSLTGAAKSAAVASVEYLKSLIITPTTAIVAAPASQPAAKAGEEKKESKEEKRKQECTSEASPEQLLQAYKETVDKRIQKLELELKAQEEREKQNAKKISTTSSKVAVLTVAHINQNQKLVEQKRILEQHQKVLARIERYHREQERIAKEAADIIGDQAHPARASFYSKFKTLFCAYLHVFYYSQVDIFEKKKGAITSIKAKSNALASKVQLASNANTGVLALDAAANGLGEVARKIGSATLSLFSSKILSSIPMLSSIAAPITSAANFAIGVLDDNAALDFNKNLAGFTPAAFEELSHIVAKTITLTYQEQIDLLKPSADGAERFAECGVNKVISALLNDKIQGNTFIQDTLYVLRNLEVTQAQVGSNSVKVSIPFRHERLEVLDEQKVYGFDITEDKLFRLTGLSLEDSKTGEVKYYSNDSQNPKDRLGTGSIPIANAQQTYAYEVGYIKTATEPTNMAEDQGGRRGPQPQKVRSSGVAASKPTTTTTLAPQSATLVSTSGTEPTSTSTLSTGNSAPAVAEDISSLMKKMLQFQQDQARRIELLEHKLAEDRRSMELLGHERAEDKSKIDQLDGSVKQVVRIFTEARSNLPARIYSGQKDDIPSQFLKSLCKATTKTFLDANSGKKDSSLSTSHKKKLKSRAAHLSRDITAAISAHDDGGRTVSARSSFATGAITDQVQHQSAAISQSQTAPNLATVAAMIATSRTSLFASSAAATTSEALSNTSISPPTTHTALPYS